MNNTVFYKIFLEATALVAVLAGASFCAELFLPGVISLSQKTLSILTVLIIMVTTARYMSLTYTDHIAKESGKNVSQNKTFFIIGVVAIVPLYIATKNFLPLQQAIMIILALLTGYLLLKEVSHITKSDSP